LLSCGNLTEQVIITVFSEVVDEVIGCFAKFYVAVFAHVPVCTVHEFIAIAIGGVEKSEFSLRSF
jgi:hypothetical protein